MMQEEFIKQETMTPENKAITAFIVLATILMAIALSACKTIQPTATDVRNDSVETYSKHDTIFQTKADSATLDALMHCDSNYNVVLDELTTANGERIKLSAALKQLQTKSNVKTPQFAFNVDCKEDSLQHRIEWLEREIKTAKSEKVVVTEKVTPKWAWWALIVCIALVSGIVVRIIIKIYARR